MERTWWTANITVQFHQEDGHCAPWAEWSGCSLSCVTERGQAGVRTRSRKCIPPKNGGDTCDDLEMEVIHCPWKDGNLITCPVNHRFSEWTPFSPCSATCGDGKKYRSRFCTQGRNGGTQCPTFSELQRESCKLKECAIPPGNHFG